MTINAHDPITPDECGESIRQTGACAHYTPEPRAPYAPTAEQKARAELSTRPGLSVLADAAPDVLLRAYASLTHRLHDASQGFTDARGFASGETAADVRAQRDLLAAELTARMTVTRTLPRCQHSDDPHTSDPTCDLAASWAVVHAGTDAPHGVTVLVCDRHVAEAEVSYPGSRQHVVTAPLAGA